MKGVDTDHRATNDAVLDSAESSSCDYEKAAAACTDQDHEDAKEVGSHLIAMVKLFLSFKSRLQDLPDADQWSVPLLHELARHPQRASDLVDTLGADPSTISRQVALMVKGGLVRRVADPGDGRASILEITEPGRARISEHGQLRGHLLAPLIAGWTPEERSTYIALTAQLNQALARSLEPMKESAAAFICQQRGRQENP